MDYLLSDELLGVVAVVDVMPMSREPVMELTSNFPNLLFSLAF